MSRMMSEHGRKLLADWEGVELQVYNDVAGLPTIGVGHLLTKSELNSGKIIIDGEAVRYHDGLYAEQVDRLLSQDLARVEGVVDSAVPMTLSPNRFDAMVSFVFNIGMGAFRRSTLLKRIRQGRWDEVPGELKRWVYSGGRKVEGLINRRENEIRLWNGEI